MQTLNIVTKNMLLTDVRKATYLTLPLGCFWSILIVKLLTSSAFERNPQGTLECLLCVYGGKNDRYGMCPSTAAYMCILRLMHTVI